MHDVLHPSPIHAPIAAHHLQALETLHQQFARDLARALGEELRTAIDVGLIQVQPISYERFIASLPDPTCLTLLKIEPLDGAACLEISPTIIFPIIDHLLGGASDELFIPPRGLTELEQRLALRLVDRCAEALSQAWSQITPARFTVGEFQPSPSLARLIPADERTVAISFELKMKGRCGTMNLAIPASSLAPVLALLGETEPPAGAPPAVRLRACLEPVQLTMGELMGLQVGDIIPTACDETAQVVVRDEDGERYTGELRQYQGRRAVHIARTSSPPAAGEGENR